MSKRVPRPSIRGKGAEIFFTGDLPPVDETATHERPSPEPNEADSEATPPPAPDEVPAAAPPSTTAIAQRTMPGVDSLWPAMRDRARNALTFRYSQQELESIDDLVHEFHGRFHIRLLKQDIARLGLNAIIQDYDDNGTHSLLAEYAQRKEVT
jgi:hypothetical protein